MENRFVARKIRPQIEKMLTMFPVVTLTGVRQCGKSTLLKSFEGYEYVSLEEPDTREYAADDPRGFLSSYKDNVIIDEAQHVPSLFSYRVLRQTRWDLHPLSDKSFNRKKYMLGQPYERTLAAE